MHNDNFLAPKVWFFKQAINRVLKATENFDDVYQNFYVTQSLQYLCKLLPQWKHRFGNTSGNCVI